MSQIVAEPEPQIVERPNPYRDGNYAPVEFESTAFSLPVTGTIPDGLAGRLVRIGPNPANQPSAHWFTGLGMVHGVRLAEGHADWYRSRYVRAGRGSRTLGIPVVAGPGSESDFNVNTTVLHLGDGVYACVEAGATPVHLSYELESLSRSDLGGATRGFAAHAKRDPLTGETIAIAYQAGRPTVQYLVVGVDGVARQRAEIAIPNMPLIHDVAITQSSVVVLDMPVTFDMAKVKPGNFPYSWNPKQGARVGLLPRDGDVTKLQWFEAPKSFVFHCFNSYDDGDKVVLDVVKHPRMFASGKTDISEGAPAVSRWILDRKTGQLSETIVDDRGAEFPRVNDTRESLAYRFGYSASADSRGKLGPIMKYDMQTGTTQVHDFGVGRAAQEPIFVARPGATAEDDGYIMSYVHDAGRNATDVVILAANDFTGAPVATVHLPVRVPFGFHGNWVADSQS